MNNERNESLAFSKRFFQSGGLAIAKTLKLWYNTWLSNGPSLVLDILMISFQLISNCVPLLASKTTSFDHLWTQFYFCFTKHLFLLTSFTIRDISEASKVNCTRLNDFYHFSTSECKQNFYFSVKTLNQSNRFDQGFDAIIYQLNLLNLEDSESDHVYRRTETLSQSFEQHSETMSFNRRFPFQLSSKDRTQKVSHKTIVQLST